MTKEKFVLLNSGGAIITKAPSSEAVAAILAGRIKGTPPTKPETYHLYELVGEILVQATAEVQEENY